MEAVLVSAATGALRSVLEKLATLLADKYKCYKGVHGEIQFLTDELAAMHAFLLKMSEEEEPDEQDKEWVNAVRELSYDMEDSIDDFMQGVGDNDNKPDGFLEKIKHSLRKLGKMKSRQQIGNEIQDLKKQIIEVGKRNQRYKTRHAVLGTINFSNTKNVVVDPRALAIFEHGSKLVGIDEPKAEIIKLLAEGESKQEQTKSLSIIGPGGMGKTTLANQVYRDLKAKFECRAFLSISRNLDIINILRTILSEVTSKGYPDTEAGSIQQLINKITDFLADKRYFVVVDDIWDVVTWDIIKLAFPMTSLGSIIITTTRKNDVAESCRSSFSGAIYGIRPLNMVLSRQLFHRRLFKSNEDCPSHLERLAYQMLRKCDGLPLAIIAISGLLANRERTEDTWNAVEKSIGRALERNPTIEGMIKILSLSYFDLPPHLKTCLLYLSIFPEDAIIQTKNLIWRWIAEGFVHKDGKHTAFELGERYFNELINRNLIQVAHTNRFGKVKSCRVHDTILDFIISKSIEENFVSLVGVPSLTVGTQRKVRRLSLQVDDQGKSVIPTCLVLSHVRSLNVFVQSFEIPSLDEFRRLRVLDFGGCMKLENHHLSNIGRLFQLRCLILRNREITELPEVIGHLCCLEVLDIRRTNVKELPATVVNLGKLVCLLMPDCVKIPDGIAKMQALEVFNWVTVFKQTSNLLHELGQLKNLRELVISLCIYSSHDDDTIRTLEVIKVIASAVQTLSRQNLRSLTINDGRNFMQEFLCSSTPLSLQSLKINVSVGSRVPNWVGSLVNLQRLCLQLNEVGHDDICILGALPALVDLILKRGPDGLHRISYYGLRFNHSKLRISGDVGFRCLRQFYFDAYYYPLHLMFEVGSMPRLDKLTMAFRLDRDIEDGVFNFGIENLPNLLILTCIIASGHMYKAAKAAAERTAKTHPNKPTLFCYSS
ncbi:hypothetical protein CFC21_099188 [Triticum aestivum]|uniref:AAA+ ATPase domain-containing protein n=2 Tax=Triticum aestivum TaxID=4565 RepID=A0A9R1L8G2_WHEAT|nr:disease resistance protein RGA5-like [Triticum aestivum]XP_044446282.1 disease resistance protein RGA5-like [Triticum aestivum]KAF7081517.1 hypothetical protein CFC21_085451 [Triticum aestivum]KAF7097364.1 hypothetical protein CFC21_099188 [Triticum aestivum]